MTDTDNTQGSEIRKSNKLDDVLYDIRGPILKKANEIEASGREVIKLNIGNPAPFGFNAPDHILSEVANNIHHSQGYSDSKGLITAREAVVEYYTELGVMNVNAEDIYIGNGVSELVVLALQGLINNGDEVLIPSPDFPLWTAATSLCGGRPIHYLCDEQMSWQPSIEDIKKKITNNTKALVLINPNNPTGSVYSEATIKELIDIARVNNLVLFADEIYDKIIFDDHRYIPTASLADDLLIITFSGLSKSYRVAGFRTGWMMISGKKSRALDYIEGLEILSSMRLCSNVPTQHAIAVALRGKQDYRLLTEPTGRLYEQRELAYELVNNIEGITCVKPMGGLYLFPRLDCVRFNIQNDEQFVLDLLEAQQVLVVQGSGFNWASPDHFRLVFLPEVSLLREAIGRIATFLSDYQQRS
ncbi:pyridoxal phosphate-dependent aminotransferase [Gammaproteobacteria bacterium]|nr:pyridoxal phosphate-dependent aminotransferase [Gammaproteobacteria bacterium]